MRVSDLNLSLLTQMSNLSQFGLVQEKFKDIKGIIRSRISKKDRQCNGQKEKKT
jgi:hypothetical protein